MKISRKWRRFWQRGKRRFMPTAAKRMHPQAKIKQQQIETVKQNVQELLRKAVRPAAAAAGIALTILTASPEAQAMPSGGQVAAGQGTIIENGKNMTIAQGSDKLALNWQSFSIAQGERVQFNQPSANAVALNRVVGNDASRIFGQLSANGKVFLTNQNGILFGQSAQVDVGGLVASSLQINDSDFLAGKYRFTQQGNGAAVINQGSIRTAEGGYAVLLGSQAINEGTIIASKGSIALAAGSQATIDMTGDGLIHLVVGEAALDAQAANKNLLQADGGMVVMTAKAADELVGAVVNNSGIIRSQSLVERNGKIVLEGGANGIVSVSGTLEASGKGRGLQGGTVKVLGNEVKLTESAVIDVSGDRGGTALIGGAYQGGSSEQAAASTTVTAGAKITADAITQGDGGQVVVWANDTTYFAGSITARGGAVSGDGGQVETSGKQVLQVADTARVNTLAARGKVGNWLLDPADFTIAPSGGNITGATVNSNLGTVNLVLASGGSINVNDLITWSSDKMLTLSASENIVFNNNVTATGTNGGLVLEYGAGKDYVLNGHAITLSGGSATLSINGAPYTLIHDASQLANASLTGNYALAQNLNVTGTTYNTSVAGTLDGTFAGLGHTISSLTIQGTAANTGLFGSTTASSLIRDLGVTGGSITNTAEYTGGLVGYNRGTISNSYFNGSVAGNINVGGLVGSNDGGTVSYSHSTGSVASTGSGDRNIVGGLVGSSNHGTIGNSYSESTVTSLGSSGYQANYVAGGLVGAAWSGGTINSSHYTGTVNGSSTVGGLVGVSFAAINNSYSTGSVYATSNDVGGLVGVNYATIANSHSDSTVTATKTNDVYAANASNDIGGLVGTNNTSATIINSYSTGNVQGTGWVGGLVGYNGTSAAINSSHSTGTADGYYSVGGLAGTNAGGSIISSNSTGNVTGANRLGGLAGKNSGDITGSTSSGTVTRSGSISVTSSSEGLAVGGLVGYNTATILGSSSSGQVASNDTGVINSTGGTLESYAGGLTGKNQGTISSSQSTSVVINSAGNSSSGIVAYYAGGLIGKEQATQDSVASNTAATLRVNGSLGLSSANLSLVSSDDIQIQSPISGVSTLTLNAGNTVSQTGAGTVAASGLKLVHGFITLDNSGNAITTVAGTANGLTLTSGTPLTVGVVGASSGLHVTEDLFLTVASTGGMLTVDNPVYRTSSASTFALTADRMQINAQVDQGQTNSTWARLSPYTAGWGVILGSTTDSAANALEISAAEYAKVGIITGGGGATSRNIQIGNGNTGAIQITGYMKNNSADDQYRPGVRLISNSSISESGTGAIEANDLVTVANGAITLNGANKVYYFAANSNNHDIKFHDALADGESLAIYPIGSYGGINAGTGNLTLAIDGTGSVVNMGSSITANGLELIAPSSRFWLYGSPGVDLTINTLAGNVGTAAIGAKNSFSIGTVGSTAGLTSNGVMVGSVFKNGLGLESGGTITQTAPITAINMYLGQGNFDLTNANNHVQRMTTYSYTKDDNIHTGNINYRDSGSLIVDTDYSNIYSTGSVTLQANSIYIPWGDPANPRYNTISPGINEPGVIDGTGIVASGAVTLKSAGDITINSDITTTAGNFVAHANSLGSGGNITISGATINSGGGNITLGGGTDLAAGYAVGDNTSKNGIYINNATLNAGTGNITLRGRGLNGIAIDNGGKVLTTTGTITAVGQGMGNAAAIPTDTTYATSTGISIAGAGLIQSSTGSISLSGAGDNTVSTNRNLGISLYGGQIESSGGAIALTGTAGGAAATTGNDGITINERNGTLAGIATIKSLTSSAGAVTLTGTGRGSNSAGVRISGRSGIESAKGNITIAGTASGQGAGQANIVGVQLYQGPLIANTGGNIEITGSAKFNPDTPLSPGQSTGNYHIGVSIDGRHAGDNTATLVQASGSVTVTGTGGGYGSNNLNTSSGTSYHNDGVDVLNGAKITSPTAISIVGTAGDGSNEWGVDGSIAAQVGDGILQGTGNGTVSITGYGGSAANASYNHGVIIISSGSVYGSELGGQVSAEDGNITVNGYGSGQFSSGVIMRGPSQLKATGNGAITVHGETFSGTAIADGSWINEAAGYYKSSSDTIAVRLSGSSQISAADGDINITGINTTNAANSPTNVASSIGINTQAGVTIKTTGTGNITLTGQGGGIAGSTLNIGVNNYGKILALGTGNITIAGTAGPAVDDTTPFGNVDWGGYSNFGVYIGGNSEFGGPWGDLARISTNGGNIKITGTNDDTHTVRYLADNGNGQPQLGNYALYIDNQSTVNAAGNGRITLEGKGLNGSVMLHVPVDTGTGRNGITTAGQEIQVSATGSLDVLREVNTGAAAINSNGGNIVMTAGKDITLNGALSSGGGNIVLAAARSFINHLPGNTGIVSGGGRYFVYSSNPTDTLEGMTGYNKHYNQAYTPGQLPDYAAAGNWFFYSVAPVIKVSPGSSQTVTYGTAPGAFTHSLTGFIDGDDSSSAGVAGSATFAIGGGKTAANNYFAGEHGVTYAGGLTNVLGYQFQNDAAAASKLIVTPASLTITAVANTKTYDGTVVASATPIVSGVQAGDSVTGLVETYTSKNAGNGKTLTVTGYTVNDGNNGNNYIVTTVENTAGTIDKASLTAGLTGTVKKTYDATLAVTLAADNYSVSGVVGGDEVVLNWPATGEYSDSNVGSGKVVTVSGLTLSGADASNYQLSSTKVSAAVGTIEENQSMKTVTETITTTRTQVPNGTTGFAPPPSSGTPAVQLINGGVHQVTPAAPGNLTQLPPMISLNAAGGQAVSYSLTVTNDAVTLSNTGGISGAASGAAPTSQANRSVALVVIEPQGTQVNSYSVRTGSGSLTIAAATQPPQAIPNEPAGTAAASGTFALTGSNGAVAEFRFVFADGAVSIKPLNAAAVVMAQDQGAARKVLAASGMLAAEEMSGIQTNSINAVYIRTE